MSLDFSSSTRDPARSGIPDQWVRLLPAFLLLAGVAVYISSLSGSFVFDDEHVLLSVSEAVGDGRLLDALKGRRWFFNLTFLANYLIDPETPTNPVLYHLVNMFVHLVAGLALFGIVGRTLSLPQFSKRFDHTKASILAFVIALLWLVHPLNTQAVTYIVQRMESMMGMFYLLTIYGLLRCAGGSAPWSRMAWGAGAVASCTLGMVTKEVMVTAPLVALLFDRTFISEGFVDTFKRRWALYGCLALSWLAMALAGTESLFDTEVSAGFAMDAIRPLPYLLSQGEVILHYLRLSFWPSPLVLDYQGWVPAFLWGPRIWAPTSIVVAVLVVISFIGLGRKTWWGFCGAWFFLILGPTSSFMPIADLVFEHRMYLSLIAVVTLVVIGGDALLRKLLEPRKGQWVGAVVVLCAATALGATTMARNLEYKSRISIWSTVIERAPYNARGWHNLASALNKVGRSDQALMCYEEVLKRRPDHAAAHNGVAGIYMDRGKLGLAIERYQQAIQIDPDDPVYHYNLGKAFLHQGKFDMAKSQFHRAIELREDYAMAYNNLGIVALGQEQLEQAGVFFRKAVELDDELIDGWYNLGKWYMEQGHLDEALKCMNQAKRLDSRQNQQRGKPAPTGRR